MELVLSQLQIYFIIKRFYSKFTPKRNKLNPYNFKFILEDFHFIRAYKRSCTYSNKKNLKKENLVIKYNYKNKEIIAMNILYDEYKDLV